VESRDGAGDGLEARDDLTEIAVRPRIATLREADHQAELAPGAEEQAERGILVVEGSGRRAGARGGAGSCGRRRPDKSFPQMAAGEAELEALYRMLNNPAGTRPSSRNVRSAGHWLVR